MCLCLYGHYIDIKKQQQRYKKTTTNKPQNINYQFILYCICNKEDKWGVHTAKLKHAYTLVNKKNIM